MYTIGYYTGYYTLRISVVLIYHSCGLLHCNTNNLFICVSECHYEV